MVFTLFLKGFILGFSIAAPVGPIGILCIRTTLAYGFLAGFFCGLGAATASSLYGAIAGFGLTLISDFLLRYRIFVSIFGGIFLLYLGVKTMITRVQSAQQTAYKRSLMSICLSTLFLTVTNPLTILSYTALFAGFGVMGCSNGCGDALSLVSGVFCGALCWWCILAGTISVFRTKLNTTSMNIINMISGLIIFGFGVYVLLSLAR